MKRRTWILGGLAATGALIVGWGVMPMRSRLGKAEHMLPTQGDVALNGWIKIANNGTVILAMPRAEMGQGVYTALPMMVAEELDVPLSQVRLEQAGSDSIYGNVLMLTGSLPFHPLESEGENRATKVKVGHWIVGKVARELGINATGGSSSVADAWDHLRLAAAMARASLLGGAAAQWKVPVGELRVKDGVVSHASGKKDQERAIFLFSDGWSRLIDAGQTVPSEQLRQRSAGLQFDDPINIQYTSGTTGFPKGATLSHHNILNNGFFVGQGCRYTEHDRVCIPVPLYHCF